MILVRLAMVSVAKPGDEARARRQQQQSIHFRARRFPFSAWAFFRWLRREELPVRLAPGGQSLFNRREGLRCNMKNRHHIAVGSFLIYCSLKIQEHRTGKSGAPTRFALNFLHTTSHHCLVIVFLRADARQIPSRACHPTPANQAGHGKFENHFSRRDFALADRATVFSK